MNACQKQFTPASIAIPARLVEPIVVLSLLILMLFLDTCMDGVCVAAVFVV